jgi:hypothetical protein
LVAGQQMVGKVELLAGRLDVLWRGHGVSGAGLFSCF